ncbi:hypothetical protein [Sciscionella sediminilitoris]|uniref:hypothetical protein n=1 Tax=Sciscionella sediminilitoris TaxID=1445613 RepID=UPI0004DFC308|nr:hypothetical protein [Sciscionella sp. SE31]
MAAIVGTTTVLGAGSASAATVTESSCTGQLPVHIGDTVSIAGSAVAGQAAQAVKNSGVWFTDPKRVSDKLKAIPSIALTGMPNKASTPISGNTIAAAVAKAYPAEKLFDPNGLGADKKTAMAAIEKELTGTCGFTAAAVDYKPPQQPSSQAPQPSHPATQSQAPSTASGTPTAPGGVSGTAQPPQARYGSGAIPAMSAPPSARYGTPDSLAAPPGERYGVPGYAPATGQLGPESAANNPVHQAGRATTLAQDPNGESSKVGIPMLIAVIALAGVSAALVRTWALRRL